MVRPETSKTVTVAAVMAASGTSTVKVPPEGFGYTARSVPTAGTPWSPMPVGRPRKLSSRELATSLSEVEYSCTNVARERFAAVQPGLTVYGVSKKSVSGYGALNATVGPETPNRLSLKA